MQLRKLSETSTTITLGWDAIPTAEWYLFYAAEVRVSNAPAFDKNGVPKTSIKFSKGQEPYEVVAVKRQGVNQYTIDSGVWQTTVPSPGPTPPAPPVGPFTVRDGNFQTVAFPDAFVRTAGDTTISKLQVQEVTGYGVGSMQFYPPQVENTGLTTISDCVANDVKRSPPGAAGGTGEANFWIGNRTRASRLKGARSGWMGMFTGSKCHNSIIEDFELEDLAVGVYVEHVTHSTTFRRFKIHNIHDQNVAGGTEPGGVLRARSISIEWWYGGEGSYNLTFEDGDIYCPAGGAPRGGVYADAGTYGLVFRRCRFWGPGNAVYLPNNRANNGPDAVFENCWFEQDGQNKIYHSSPIG